MTVQYSTPQHFTLPVGHSVTLFTKYVGVTDDKEFTLTNFSLSNLAVKKLLTSNAFAFFRIRCMGVGTLSHSIQVIGIKARGT